MTKEFITVVSLFLLPFLEVYICSCPVECAIVRCVPPLNWKLVMSRQVGAEC